MAMTDEERAREIAADLGACETERRYWVDRLLPWIAAVRADQREKCAKLAEQPFQRCAVSGDVVVPPYVASSIAAAIRAMGDKGNG